MQILLTNYAIDPKRLEPTTQTKLEYNIPIVDHPMLISIQLPTPRRTAEAAGKNNGGYDLTINNLPWANSACSIKRYRIDRTHDLSLIDTIQGKSRTVHVKAALPPPSIELIVVQRLHE